MESINKESWFFNRKQTVGPRVHPVTSPWWTHYRSSASSWFAPDGLGSALRYDWPLARRRDVHPGWSARAVPKKKLPLLQMDGCCRWLVNENHLTYVVDGWLTVHWTLKPVSATYLPVMFGWLIYLLSWGETIITTYQITHIFHKLSNLILYQSIPIITNRQIFECTTVTSFW